MALRALRPAAPPIGLVLAILLGMLAAIAAAILGHTQPKVMLTGTAGLAAITVALCLGSSSRVVAACLAVLVFGMAINIDVTFFYQEEAQHYFLSQSGSVTGVTITATTIAGVGLCLLYAWQYLNGQRPHVFRWQAMLVSAQLLYMGAGLLSMINAASHLLVTLELLRQVMVFIVFLALMSMDERQIRLFLVFLAVAVISQGAIGVVQVAGNTQLGLDFFGETESVDGYIGHTFRTRATGTIGHPNILGYFFEITVPVMLAAFLVIREPFARSLFFLAAGAGIAGALATMSRGTWGALMAVLPLVFVFCHWRELLRVKTAMAAVVAGFLVIGGGIAAWPTIETRLFEDDGGSASTRTPTNIAALSVIEQFPTFGVGLNNFAGAYVRYDETGGSRTWGVINHVVHNMYLLVWGELGTVGLVSFLWLFGAAFWVAIGIMRRGPPWASAIAAGVAAGLAAHLIHGAVDPGFKLNQSISYLVFAMFGLLGAVRLTTAEAGDGR